MATPQEQRKIRLKNDFAEMKNIKGNIVTWVGKRGIEPYIEEYELTIQIRSIVGRVPTYHNSFKMKVVLADTYPFSAAPQITMLSTPYPFHPNWYTSGKWCYGTWVMSESLGHHIIRMIRTLQYDADITNEHSPANPDAKDWYISKRNSGLFPCDNTVLPDPTKSVMTESTVIVKPKFSVNTGNEQSSGEANTIDTAGKFRISANEEEPQPKKKFDIK